MKKGLLGSTALIAATALTAGMAQAQEPTVSFGGFINFQAYVPDQDVLTVGGISLQDNFAYFGVDDAEFHINVSGTADNGLEYGAKIEMEAVQGGTGNADEARIQLRGSWGTLQMGDEDGAEDIMNYGGENVMGATGGFDGDQDDWYVNIGSATSFPTIAGDTSDRTKITYYSPRFSGIQVGVSWTPVVGGGGQLQGDAFKADLTYENHIGLGVNYDGSFGDVRVRVSGVYSTAGLSSIAEAVLGPTFEDIAAWSVGTIIGVGPFQVGANYTDNGESISATSGLDGSYWNVAAGFTSGPLYLSVGYLSSVQDVSPVFEDEYTHIALSVDYDVAPGLTAYAEYSIIESKADGAVPVTNDGNGLIAGVNLSF